MMIVFDVGKKLLEEPFENQTDFRSDRMLKKQYRLCMNEEVREDAGITPLQNTLKQIGGWPILEKEKWSRSWESRTGMKYSWYEQALLIRDQGYISSARAIIDFDVEMGPNYNAKNILSINSPVSRFQNKPFLLQGFNSKYTEEYFEVMLRASELLGANREDIEEELEKLSSLK